MRPLTVLAGILAALVVAAAVFLLPRLDAAKMLDRRWDGIVADIEGQSWGGVLGALDPEYRDAWGFGEEEAVGGLRLARQTFTRIDITLESRRVAIDGLTATTTALVRIDGEGNAGSTVIQRRVNGLVEPWTFTWRRSAWRPWSWQLVRTEHPSLQMQGLEALGF